MWAVQEQLLKDDSLVASNRNIDLLPNHIRSLIQDSSGTGKTTLGIDNLVLAADWLDWTAGHVFPKVGNCPNTKISSCVRGFNDSGEENCYIVVINPSSRGMPTWLCYHFR